MSIEEAAPTKKKIISKDFRTVVVSSIGGGANENLVHLTFGLEIPDPDTMEDSIMEEVRLVMTPRTLKLTQKVLTDLVATLEAAMGEIPLGPTPTPKTHIKSSK